MSTRRRGTEVPRITSAPEALADDLARRQRRYLVQMGVRVVCFLTGVLSWGHIPLWASVVLLVGAVVLPYVAVIFANAGRERREVGDAFVEPREIGDGPHTGRLGGRP